MTSSPCVFPGGVADAVWVGTVLAPWLSIDELERGFARTCRRGLEWARRAQALARHWSPRTFAIEFDRETASRVVRPARVVWPPAKRCTHLRLESLVVAKPPLGRPISLPPADQRSLDAIVRASASRLVELDLGGCEVRGINVNRWPCLERLERLTVRFRDPDEDKPVMVQQPALTRLDTNYMWALFPQCTLRILQWTTASELSIFARWPLDSMINVLVNLDCMRTLEEVRLIANGSSDGAVLTHLVRALVESYPTLRRLTLEHDAVDQWWNERPQTWSGEFTLDRDTGCARLEEGDEGVHRSWLEWLPAPLAHLQFVHRKDAPDVDSTAKGKWLQRLAPTRLAMDMSLAGTLPVSAFASVKHFYPCFWTSSPILHATDFDWMTFALPQTSTVTIGSENIRAAQQNGEHIQFRLLPRIRLVADVKPDWHDIWLAASTNVESVRPSDAYPFCDCRR